MSLVAHTGFEPVISSLRGRCPKPTRRMRHDGYNTGKHKKLTTDLLEKFIISRPQGASSRSIENYHYTLANFVGHPITPEGMNSYLASLRCQNGKAKFYSCLRALSRWLYHKGNTPIDKHGFSTYNRLPQY